MAIMIIITDDNGNQVKTISEKWEEQCYQVGCEVAMLVASQFLQETDKHSNDLRPKDSPKRTITTRFGDISVKRRMYKDKKGKYHFLLETIPASY